jgi:hypothetical protein
MMTTIVINENNPQAEQLVKYIKTLPFATIVEDKESKLSSWEVAIAEGAVPAEEFFGEVRRQIKEHYNRHA